MLGRNRFGSCRFWMSLIGLVVALRFGTALPESHGDEPIGRVGASLSHVSSAGTGAYVPDRWGLLRLHFKNPTSEPIELLASTYFEEEPTLQFARRAWIPAMSSLQLSQPTLMPSGASAGRQRFDFRTLLMETAQQREVLIRANSGALQLDGLVRALDGKQVVGLIDEIGQPEVKNAVTLNDLLLCVQSSIIPNGDTTYLTDRLLPAGDECLQSLDQLVIADSRVLDDLAGLAAIRRWLFSGGNLWVALDRVDPQVLERLLGDESQSEVIDRVGLTTVRLEVKSPNGNVLRDVRDYEQPVDFVRVLTSGVEVACTIDGWPAAFWKTCGEGRLLVTTLGHRGWMRRATATDHATTSNFGRRDSSPSQQGASVRSSSDSPMVNGSTWKSPFVPLEAARDFAADFFRRRSEPRLSKATLEPLVQEYVGYSIPARWQVIGLLMGFSLLLGVLGVWMWRRTRLEVLGIVSPLLALLVSGVLVFLGWQQRQSVPAAVASVQFVRAISGTDDVQVEGVAGLFSPEPGLAQIESKQGGLMMPEMSGTQGKTRRMVWTDLDEWHWENLPEAAGLMTATVQQSSMMSERLEARATFDSQGLSGRLQATSALDPTDAVLVTRSGRMGVDLREDGTFVAKTADVFSAEQFLGADLLSDEQHRRQRVLVQLLNDPQRRDYPTEPQLLFWSKPWHRGMQFASNRQTLGSALVAVPLKLERPPTGTVVSLAAPLLSYREVIGPDDVGLSGLWDHRRREWQEKSFPTMTWLRFQIPPVLLPVEVQRGRLVVRVAGPVVQLGIAGHRLRQNDVVPIETWNDPVGTLSVELTNPEMLQLSSDGGLILRVAAGDPKLLEQTTKPSDPGEKVSYWRIESLALELHVKTTEVP